MWRIRRWVILPALALLITAMAAISMPQANADTSLDPGNHACALEHNGLLRYAAVAAECDYQGKSAARRHHHDQPPVLGDIESAPLRYAAGAPPVRATASLTVSSPATGTLAGATVSVSSGFTAGQDVLGFTGRSGIAGSYSASTGVLTFTGTATVSAYQAALRSVTYRDSNAATPYGAREISFQVSDGEPDHPLSNVVSRTVLIQAEPPVAVSDKAATGKNAPVTISVLANDTDPAGLPLTIASVSTTGTKGKVKVNPGETTVTYNPNGQFSGLTAGQTATDTFTYKATDGTQTSNSAAVTVTIIGSNAMQPPTVTAHAYRAIGNTPLGVGTTPPAPAATVSGTVLSGDSDADPTATLSVTSSTAPAHGTVTVSPNGTFTYLPNLGYTGADTFQCTIAGSNAPAVTATETITITVGTVVWYVNDSLTAAGNGEAASPFGTLAAANTAAGANSILFLYQGAYAGNVTMQPGEDLFGQPHGLTVDGYSLVPPGGSTPGIVNSSGSGIDLAEGADVEGVSVIPQYMSSRDPAPGISAVNVNNATVGATSPVTIEGAIDISGGDGNLNFGDTSVDFNSAFGEGVSVADRTGGTVTFGGPITAPTVTLTDNAGATIAFTGTLGLNGDEPGGGAFEATGGGTITATGTGSTLNGLGALTVRNTTIGAAGLTFQAISSDFIGLDNTGTSGGLTVTGTGPPGSGGTIQNSTGDGIQLTSTYESSFTDMVIKNNSDDGIIWLTPPQSGPLINALTLADCTISGNGTQRNVSGGNDDGLDADAVGETNATVSVTGSAFTNNYGDAFQFTTDSASSGTVWVTFSNNTLSSTATGILGGGVVITPDGNAQATIAVDGNNIQNAADDGIEVGDPGNGALVGTVSGNTIGTPAVAGSGGAGIGVSAGGSVNEILAITGNHLYQYSNQAGINFTDSEALMNLTITGNTIADPGAKAVWGIHGQAGALSGDDGTVCAAITGNSIAGSGRAGQGGADVELDQDDATTIDLPGYGGGPGDASAVESFLQGGNDGNGTPTAVATASGSGGGFTGDHRCLSPSGVTLLPPVLAELAHHAALGVLDLARLGEDGPTGRAPLPQRGLMAERDSFRDARMTPSAEYFR